MAKTPAKTQLEPIRRPLSLERQKKFVALLMAGYTEQEIACKLDPRKGRKYRRIRGEVRWTARNSPEFLEWQEAQAGGAMVIALPKVGEALIRRANRGRIDAAKLILEMTGVHNPKVKHEHSGDISISLNMPRPPVVENDIVGAPALASPEEAIVDADVVED